MKVKELINQLSKLHEDGDVFIAQHIEDEEGEQISTHYMEIELAPWNIPEDDMYILYPGKLISE